MPSWRDTNGPDPGEGIHNFHTATKGFQGLSIGSPDRRARLQRLRLLGYDRRCSVHIAYQFAWQMITVMLAKRCPVCASVLDEEDLFCPNCGRETPVSPGEAASPRPQALVFKNRFTCAGCGAAMSYDASARALRCPFCGSVELRPQPDGQTVFPSKVIPFAIDREQALQILRVQMKSGFFLPSDLAQEAAVTQIVPVFVPFWCFSAETHTYWTADTNQVPLTARGNWRPLFGELRNSYDSVLVPASSVLTYEETRGLGRYDFSQAVPANAIDLENITVEQFRVPRKYARPLAKRIIEELETAESIRRYIPGSARNVHVNVKVTKLAGEPVLLPVWILAYRYRGRVYRFVINGQSGRPFGQLPLSPWKIVLACLILGAVVLGIVVLLSAVFR